MSIGWNYWLAISILNEKKTTYKTKRHMRCSQTRYDVRHILFAASHFDMALPRSYPLSLCDLISDKLSSKWFSDISSIVYKSKWLRAVIYDDMSV